MNQRTLSRNFDVGHSGHSLWDTWDTLRGTLCVNIEKKSSGTKNVTQQKIDEMTVRGS